MPKVPKIWAQLTRENIGRCVAVVLDDHVYSFPVVNTEIPNGSSQISGGFTPEEAKDLANVLKTGKMAASVKIVQEDIVGPSLGQEAIRSGVISFIFALVLLMIYMIGVYGVVPGWSLMWLLFSTCSLRWVFWHRSKRCLLSRVLPVWFFRSELPSMPMC